MVNGYYQLFLVSNYPKSQFTFSTLISHIIKTIDKRGDNQLS